MHTPKIIPVIFASLSFVLLMAQDVRPVKDCECNQLIRTRHFQGVIFCASGNEPIPVDPYKSRFTPAPGDVMLAEELILAQIDELDSSKNYEGGIHMPVIRRNLGGYERQYFGLVNGLDQRVLWINFMWNKYAIAFTDRHCHYTSVLKDDTFFWSIYVNLDTGRCYKLVTSGP